jgi:xylan 1,4-beta-xylosidase
MKQLFSLKVWKLGTTVLFILVLLSLSPVSSGQQTQASSQNFAIDVNINQSIGEMYPMWAYFGYDEPNYTYMADGRKIISELSDLSPVPVYYRAHNLLNTDDGPRATYKWGSSNVYTEDEQGNPVYDWTIIDKIFDTYIERGGKPLVEIGFMPKALSARPEPYRLQWTADPNLRPPNLRENSGIAYPPKDYEKWAELVYQWVRHSVDRYGKEEVETWWWEVWNEPTGWFIGTTEEYCKLYDYSVDAVKRALPSARVGGPTDGSSAAITDPEMVLMRDFLEHCHNGTNYVTGKTGSPLDYITWHVKGRPGVVGDGQHVQMNMSRELNGIVIGFEIMKAFPKFKDLPIILGEVDPEGCAACPVEFYPANTYRNGSLYASYTASSFARIYDLVDDYGMNFEGALSWSFIFEDQPWFAGFRTLATNGVDKPVLNVFRMFGMMAGDRIEVSQAGHMTAQDIINMGVRGDQPDVHAMASREDKEVMVMVWNFHENDIPAPDADVTINVVGIPDGRALVHHYRIDDDHSNAYTVWQEMGAPQQVTRDQYKKLEASGQLELLTSPEWIDVSDGKAPVQFSLPRQGVSFLQISW